jgi:Tol biopolymer transport system component
VGALSAGQTLSHYRILRPLGAGGMGEVYLAEDLRLGRQVALKVLAHESAGDPDRRARFEREARAVAALNHPGIVTIHSVEEDAGLLFLTMEVVEGTTLSEHIPAGGMGLNDLLRIGIPLSDAVGTAHQRGITHRDLKPANVMVGADGRVKVLDFGLAKQQAPDAFQGETAVLPNAHLTEEGKILGTVAYMSPEQAQGKHVDQRSDIFSLGIVLFEMSTGRKPFTGDSNVSVLSSILKDTPPLVTDVRPDLPREVSRIVKRCLAKDPEERYQTAKDLRNDLKALKEDSESGELTRNVPIVTATSVGLAPPASAPARDSKRGMWIGFVAAVLLAGGIAAAWWSSPSPRPRVIATRQVTTDGDQKSAPVTDGSRLYFNVTKLRNVGGGGAALAQVAATGGETVQIAPTAPLIQDIDVDGTELLVSNVPGTGDGDLAVRPIVGGAERRVGNVRINHTGLIGASAAWTADKQHVIYATASQLWLAKPDGNEARLLLTAPGVPFAPRLSADGTQLRYSVRDNTTALSALWEAAGDGSVAHPLLPGWTGGLDACCGTWTADGRYYVFEADGNLWALAESRSIFRRGSDAPVQLTFGPVRFSGALPSRDGKHLFAVGDIPRGRLVRYDAASKQLEPYLGGLSAEGVVVSPDGQWVAYTSYPDGTLWRSRLDGSERLSLTSGKTIAALPRWSPDGSQIAFFAWTGSWTSADSRRIYVVQANGGTPRRLTTGGRPEGDPSWSKDGRRIAFGSVPGNSVGASDATIDVLDVTTGKATTVPGSRGFFSPRWSPDGRYILATSLDSLHFVLFEVDTDRRIDLLSGGSIGVGWPCWSPDSQSVWYMQNPELRRITIADRKVETIASVKGLNIASGPLGQWFGWTPDGAPLFQLDAGTHDIYALDWEAP